MTARQIPRKQGYRYEVYVPGTSLVGEEVPGQVPTEVAATSQVPDGQVPPPAGTELLEALHIVDRLTRENLELAGRVGFLQGQLESARERILLLEAPKPAESVPTVVDTAESARQRPWWRFWQRA